MKISDIKTFIMQGGNRDWVFCKVETDEGVHGWGEGTLERHEEAVESGIKTHAACWSDLPKRDQRRSNDHERQID